MAGHYYSCYAVDVDNSIFSERHPVKPGKVKTVSIETFDSMRSLGMVFGDFAAMNDTKRKPHRKPRLVSLTTATEEEFFVVSKRGKILRLVLPKFPNLQPLHTLFEYGGEGCSDVTAIRLTDMETGDIKRYLQRS